MVFNCNMNIDAAFLLGRLEAALVITIVTLSILLAPRARERERYI